MSRLIYGVGINDAEYITQPTINGKIKVCVFYQTWASMLQRCYSSKLHERYSTYIGCITCNEWLSFMNFRSWMNKQDYKGKQLDKDILIEGNKIYSPDTCIFISNQINSLFNNQASKRGKYPQGVCKDKNKYRANMNKYGKDMYIGNFNTIMEAEKAYLVAKSLHVVEIAEKEDGKLKAILLDRAEKLFKKSKELEQKEVALNI